MSLQVSHEEVFGIVANHLLEQRVRCKDEENECCYLNEAGGRCAAGALLTPEEALEAEEIGGGWSNLQEEGMELGRFNDCEELIYALQVMHDNSDNWGYALLLIAEKRAIEVPPELRTRLADSIGLLPEAPELP